MFPHHIDAPMRDPIADNISELILTFANLDTSSAAIIDSVMKTEDHIPPFGPFFMYNGGDTNPTGKMSTIPFKKRPIGNILLDAESGHIREKPKLLLETSNSKSMSLPATERTKLILPAPNKKLRFGEAEDTVPGTSTITTSPEHEPRCLQLHHPIYHQQTQTPSANVLTTETPRHKLPSPHMDDGFEPPSFPISTEIGINNQTQPSQYDEMYDAIDENIWKQIDESVLLYKETRTMQPNNTSSSMKCTSPAVDDRIPLHPLVSRHVFISNPVQKAVHQYVVNNIPAPFPARSPRIVAIHKLNWVDHRTFGLSMQIYGSISHHVMNIMGTAVMEDQFRKHLRGLLHPADWSRHVFHSTTTVFLQDPQLDPSDISSSFSEKCNGYQLDNADLIFIPLCRKRFWYVVVVNIRHKRFEVICPFNDLGVIKDDALNVISNFQKVFQLAYPRSRRAQVHAMDIAFASVSNSTN